ncbi:translocon-associated protein subunit alpha isoform X5 [Saccopteryx leptura]|uniref:translocon-associated protein subunit alpha isoform X5 n=1 Tax=Saccopteryx leptura TaxID=249018 RepID=UPI00339C61CD
MRLLPRLLLLLLLVFPATLLLRGGPGGSIAAAQDLTEDEETVEDSVIEDEDDEAEVEEDEPTDLAEDKEEEDVSGEPEASPSADTTILFVKGEDFPANNIVKFLVGFTNKGTEDFIVESLDASFRYPQDYQFYIQNFTALPLNTVVPPQRQATFEYSFIPAEPMGGRPFGLVINLNYKDLNIKLHQEGCPGNGHRRDQWDLMNAGGGRRTDVVIRFLLQLCHLMSPGARAVHSAEAATGNPWTCGSWRQAILSAPFCYL